MPPKNQNACEKLHSFQGCAGPLWNYNNAADTTWSYEAATRKVMFRHKAWTLTMKTGHYTEVTTTMTSGDQFEDKLFAFSLSSYKQFEQQSSY